MLAKPFISFISQMLKDFDSDAHLLDFGKPYIHIQLETDTCAVRPLHAVAINYLEFYFKN